ncbi:RdgB/HAM1 family non-canonical purine NTP pyrophosphatase [Dermatophilus congolensis]|uniref:RdgB/HAM1 family non-canonical purine NTP pyrophosphatase n=1 Tax=Dermatophilus congolensis TaxID=1863 RepID=UPI001AAF6C2A|nr:RdgB/HAM1 family non-canonical purine NTP pyrophosphatase [Dermatophilus congolensis]MBO3151513.1 RdgB/HAM1 family non-canonical purine NTP pyrophosphatase [Dermatophilus congolensis]MBO3161485.1 RdgB/HAM1 family non-canonical purine NTP pyrophosphatase [Dermatophilus congolensis]MBO3162798.1 RdgB/HAM1 family non-canonical purine NTP pyrophosphatase [Dermatophilus congolensis]MBO3176352.1 RdgB/HAM1 family non-canonical purine NTP pyrophosphatase [Dermatophilus congolensis]
MSRRIVLATRNAGKVNELRDILADVLTDLDLELVGIDAFPDAHDVVETGVTFQANALLKAQAAVAATGLPCLADDSGLAVDVLGGAPGVFSARWSGKHGDDQANLDLLLAQIADVPDEHRAAAFVCAAALVLPDGRSAVRMGRFTGTIVREPRGTNGFGYDPILLVDGDTRTSAELSPQEKNERSHRGKAFAALAADLRELLG